MLCVFKASLQKVHIQKMGSCCCCCLPYESSRTIDEHVPLSRPRPSAVSTETEDRNSVSDRYTSQLPPIPLIISPRDLQTPPRLPRTESNSSEGAHGTAIAKVTEKEIWTSDDLNDLDLKKQDREMIEECPICLEEYETENPRLITKCNHHFHLACILEWMERSEACPVCDKELELTDS